MSRKSTRMLSVCAWLSRRPLVVGMMMGLIINLGFVPLLQARGAYAMQPVLQPGGTVRPGEAEPVRNSAYIYGVQSAIFGELFDTAWSETNWTYPLTEEVEGLGSYFGVNHHGQEFELQAYFVAHLDMDSLTLDAAGQEAVAEREMEFASVAGKLVTGLAEVPVHGTVASYLNNQGVREVHFMCTDYLDPQSAIFLDPPPEPVIELVMEMRETTVAVSTEATGSGDDCEAACQAAYNAAVAAAEAAYQNAVNLSAATQAISIGLCNATYNAAKTAADDTLAICLIAATAVQTICTIASLTCGFFVLGCVLACKAVYAVAVAACIATHRVAVNAAAATRTACIAAANAIHAATVAAAAAARAAAITAAEQALAACLAGCPGAGGNTEVIKETIPVQTPVVNY